MVSLGGGLLGTLVPIALIGAAVYFTNVACSINPAFGAGCGGQSFKNVKPVLTPAGSKIAASPSPTSDAVKGALAPFGPISHHTGDERLTIA